MKKCRKRRVGFSVKALSNEIMRFLHAGTHDSEVTGMQRGILHFIGDFEGDVFQKDVEKEFNIRRSTATGMMQLLEKNGMILREPVPGDARLKKLVLTEKAEAFREQAIKDIDRIEKAMTLGITQEELDTFFNVIEKIRKNIT